MEWSYRYFFLFFIVTQELSGHHHYLIIIMSKISSCLPTNPLPFIVIITFTT